jgi:hypothetical protein
MKRKGDSRCKAIIEQVNEMKTSTDWLLEGPPWVEYLTRLDLLCQSEQAPEVRQARDAMIADADVQQLVEELARWPGPPLKSHKTAGHPLHRLTFLADLGLGAGNPQVERIANTVLSHRSPQGPLQILMNINPRYGGTGKDQWVWMLCDAPLVLYSLVRFGLGDDAALQAAINHLIILQRENGWPCAVCPELGKFKGPGRKDDPCPYATLVMLKLLSQVPGQRSSEASRIGVETLLTLWEQRRERRPYLFAMGSGFEKLKTPLIWYDILHVAEVLSHFPWARGDPRLQQMAGLVREQADSTGRFKAGSVWRDWKEWEFGQKREPSYFVTLIATRMLARLLC